MSPTLVRFVWDYAKSGSLVCPWALSPKECSLALDYFGFNNGEGLDIIIADDDPRKTSKLFAYCAFKNTRKAVPGVIQHVKFHLSSNQLSSGMHFIVAPPRPVDLMSDTLMDYYRVEHLPSGFNAIELNVISEKVYARSSFDALSPDTDNAAEARNEVLAGVLAIGGIQAHWSQRRLKVCDVGEFGQHHFHSAKCHVLEVKPEGNDGVDETQGMSFVSESEKDEQHGPSSKRKRNDSSETYYRGKRDVLDLL